MPTKYKAITEKGIFKDNMTTQEALDFRCDNEKGIYVGVCKELLKYKMVAYEVSDVAPEISDSDKCKTKFLQSLSLAQIHDIEIGFKRVEFKTGMGFVLVKTGKIENENGAGFSKMEMLAKDNRNVKKEYVKGKQYRYGRIDDSLIEYFDVINDGGGNYLICKKSFQITISLKFDV